MKALNYRFAPVLIAAALTAHPVCAKSKHDKQPPAEPQDQIKVEARVPVAQGVVTGFVFTQHYNRRYVYAQRASGEPPMLIDITRRDSPKVLSTLSAAGDAKSENLVAGAGTAVVAADSAPLAAAPHPQTIRIIDYSDATHPKIAREFAGVTAISNQNGVILLANPEGIWILSQKLADDPDEDARYARKVVYGESMY